jgi:ribosome biogenesis GTPase / thiamine phosphate phosphatase
VIARRPAMSLAHLGWTPTLDEAFRPYASQGMVPARVAVEHRSVYTLYAEAGEVVATLAGRLRHAAEQGGDLPAVGDWVAASLPPGEGRAIVHAVLPRSSKFSRKVAGRATEEQVVAANVDVVFVVTAAGADVNPRRLERYLALAWESGAKPAVVVSKADVDPDPAETMRLVSAVAPGVAAHRVSSVTGEGLDALRAYLREGRTVALLGSSGVGKSTLVNILLGAARQRTAEVRDDGRGRHTTTRRELIPLPTGGLLLDTPGMRELQLWDAGTGLAGTFEDVAALAASCRFVDCRHESEPGCAVLAAAAAGRLDPERLESYRKLRAELEYLDARHDEAARAAAKREARAANRALQSRLNEKYK